MLPFFAWISSRWTVTEYQSAESHGKSVTADKKNAFKPSTYARVNDCPFLPARFRFDYSTFIAHCVSFTCVYKNNIGKILTHSGRLFLPSPASVFCNVDPSFCARDPSCLLINKKNRVEATI